MRFLLLSALFASSALFAQAQEPAGVDGKWTVSLSAGGRESRQECTFVNKDRELTGKCASDRGNVDLTGKVEGKKIEWTIKVESEAGPVTVVFKGTQDAADHMAGTVLALEYSVEGEFTATRAK